MIFPGSRYEPTGMFKMTRPDGSTVQTLKLPLPGLPLLRGYYRRLDGQRLDLIANAFIKDAKVKGEIPGELEYAVLDVSEPIIGVFDVIIGRAILHHLDYQEVLQRLSRDNLNEHGQMVFYEPLGSNWLMRVFQHFSKSAHTEDERPFERQDLTWFNMVFPGFRFIPVNFLSIPLGALSSLLFSQPDNTVLRVADRIDRFIARRVSFLHAYFRYGIFVIRK